MTFETLKVQVGDAVLFVEISAPPMNLLGPALVRDLVSLIQETEADDTRRECSFSRAPIAQLRFFDGCCPCDMQRRFDPILPFTT